MKYFDYFKGIVFGLILVGAVSYVSAQSSWTPATQPPPAGNVFAPINVGGDEQTKIGKLTVGSLAVDGIATADGAILGDGGIAIMDGTQGTGKVLTSDANGLAYWADLPASGGGEVITVGYSICLTESTAPVYGSTSCPVSHPTEIHRTEPFGISLDGCNTWRQLVLITCSL